MPTGRFAPSPTGPLHIGSLRTALLAWLFARSSGSQFLLRIEDLDPAATRHGIEAQHLADLEALGLTWDGEVARQSEGRSAHDAAIGRLVDDGRTYPCYCTRREVAEAASAPHGPTPDGTYPGTCRDLSGSQRAAREAEGRWPALRLRADAEIVTVVDRRRGGTTMTVDDFVIRRNDGVPAYNLAVVVDDAAQAVAEVVRGDDLLPTTPRQALLARLLGLPPVVYAHVPLVLGPDGVRLAKRHGSVTLADQLAGGRAAPEVCGLLAASVGLTSPGEAVGPAELADLVARFDPSRLPTEPWVFDG